MTSTPYSTHKLPISLVFLVLANLVPLLGVLIWDWKIIPIMLVFWLENIIVGIFFILRILTAGVGGNQQIPPAYRLVGALFFTIHFGIFTFIHGMFVFLLFGESTEHGTSVDLGDVMSVITEYHLQWAIAALLISHGVSYLSNYLLGGESRNTSIISLMSRPYLRVAILHLTIIFGGFAVVILNQPMIGLIVLIVVKMSIDIWAHLIEHGFAASPFKPK